MVLSHHHWRCRVDRTRTETAGDLFARDGEITFAV